MNINFTARHTTITPEVEEYCKKRIETIEKLLGYPVEVNIVLSLEKYRNKVEVKIKIKGATINAEEETHEKYRNKVEVKIKIKGATINAEEETQDMLSSLSVVFDNIERRIKKEKEKLRKRKRRKNNEITGLSSTSESQELEKRVIRSGNFSLKPILVDEALMLFESSKEDAFVFRKFSSEKWAVLYRRKDGNIGLIEPE
jgi:putative sigma-54 modulation protein